MNDLTPEQYATKWQGSCPTCRKQESEDAIAWRESHRVPKEVWFPENSVEIWEDTPEFWRHECATCDTRWTLHFALIGAEIEDATYPHIL